MTLPRRARSTNSGGAISGTEAGSASAAAPEAETVTRGYTLQRWVSACAGRGAYAIKFNGSIFTVEERDGDNGQVRSGLARLGRRLLVAEHPPALLAHARLRRLRPHAAAVPDVLQHPRTGQGPQPHLVQLRRRLRHRDHELLGPDEQRRLRVEPRGKTGLRHGQSLHPLDLVERAGPVDDDARLLRSHPGPAGSSRSSSCRGPTPWSCISTPASSATRRASW